MLWYLADGSLNDYLKSQVVLQGQYYSGQETNVAQANFVSNTGVLTFDHLTLANINNSPKNERILKDNVIVIDQVVVQLAPVQTPSTPQKKNNDISKKVQHIWVEKVTINKLRFNLTEAFTEDLIDNLTENSTESSAESSTENLTKIAKENHLSNLIQLQQQVSQKLATDYPALYPDIAAKLYAKQHPELNAALVEHSQENVEIKETIENNQAVIESQAAKHQKRILGKATTRITILAFTIKSLEINRKTEDGKQVIQYLNNIELPVIGEKHGLASNQVGGEIIRLLLQKAIQLQQTEE